MTRTVKDVMTAKVETIHGNASFKEIVTVMRRGRLSALPVLGDDNRVVGIVSEADLLLKEAFSAGPDSGRPHRPRDRAKAAALTAGDLMTSPAITVHPDCTVEAAARVMIKQRVKRLPVVSPTGHLAGIVSRVDVLGLYDRRDDDIRAEIIEDVLTDLFLLTPRTIGVQVESGIVTLGGTVDDETVAVALLKSIRAVDGVVDVRDQLRYAKEG